MVKTLGRLNELILKPFNGSSAFAPQVLIGLGCITLRPLAILMNKDEERDKRIPAAARIFATEIIALPIALAVAGAAGKLGKTLSKNMKNTEPLESLAQLTGFMAANFMIPQIATLSLHKFPIKEKLASLILKKKNETPVTTVATGCSPIKNSNVPAVKLYNKIQQSQAYSGVKPYTGGLKV